MSLVSHRISAVSSCPGALGRRASAASRRLLRILLIIATLLALLICAAAAPQDASSIKPEDLPERVAQLIVEKPKPPPPPPPPEPEKKPEPEKPKPTEQKPTEKPKVNVRNQGLLAMQDELAALRDQNLDLADPQMKAPVEDARSERNLITSQAGRASGGINTANMARGFGGGAGDIGTHTTTPGAARRGSRSECRRQGAAHRHQWQGLACARRSRDRLRPEQGRVVCAVWPRAAR